MPHQITCELDKSRLNRVLSRETVQSLSFAKDYDVKNFIIKMHLYRRDSTQLKSELSRVVAAICAHITSIARRMTRPASRVGSGWVEKSQKRSGGQVMWRQAASPDLLTSSATSRPNPTRPDPTLLAAGGRSDGCAKTSDSVIG